MLIREFIHALEKVVPLGAVGYERDAVGLQVGFESSVELSKALVAYEVTHEVVREAVEVEANLIVAFHPLIFPSLSSVTDRTRTGSLVRELIRSDIALYVQHTAFDSHPRFGTSRLMANALGLKNIRPLQPLSSTLNKIVVFVPPTSLQSVRQALTNAGAGVIGNYEECGFEVSGLGSFRGNAASLPAIGESEILVNVEEVRLEMIVERWNTSSAVLAMITAHPYEQVAYDIIPLANPSQNFGMGALGTWDSRISEEETLQRAKRTFGSAILRHSAFAGKRIERVAVLGGAGMDFYGATVGAGADAFITSDVRYHDFHRARHDGILLIDAGHAETERFVVTGMVEAAKLALSGLPEDAPFVESIICASREQPNAVCYF
jgi:dinuclear metal center YbgI/SA1388 family protein